MNNRALTPAEKAAFLRELADVLEKYGVDITVVPDENVWEPGCPTADLDDFYGHTVIQSDSMISPRVLREAANQLRPQ